MHFTFTRVLAVFLCLFYLSHSSSGQCGVAPVSGLTTITSSNAIENSYYPGTGNPTIGSTTLTVGAIDDRSNAPALSSGDMILIIQMQGADINSSNSESYGDGVSDAIASGYLSNNLMAGKYEYNIVSNYNSGSGEITLAYTLANNYYTRTYSPTTGKQAFQVIRVPRYYNLTIDASGSVTAPAWNGSTGGVIVLEAANVLTIDGSVVADGLGFRGGGGKHFTGATLGNSNGSGTIMNTDFRWSSPVSNGSNTTGGAKGEGIAGTPIYTLENGATTTSTQSPEGYINGSMGRGAPGNAGGGGTDGDPSRNRYNPGGGGGGNGGAGGKGGSGWDNGPGNPDTYPTGGFGGAAFAQASLSQFIMGGGGGAGTSNNSANGTEYLSSGGAGGGIIIIRARSYSGGGTVTANGAAANNVSAAGVTDAAGGGGAGGTIILVTNQAGSAGSHTITASATGGKGGDMTSHYAHGPGGGGGGGFVVTNALPLSSVTVTGGSNGLTRSDNPSGPIDDVYGSFSGSDGIAMVLTSHPILYNSNNTSSACGTLPITLKSFSGVYKNNKITLSWQTDAGINFSHFVVEHSNNGIDFSPLSRVDPVSATNATTLYYSYVDAFPASGTNYYRLKMVDNDGQFRYSNIITIRTNIKGFNLYASPNPFSDQIVITVESNTNEIVHLRMFNSEGKPVWRKTTYVTAGVNVQYFKDVQSLPKGIYYLKVNGTNINAEIKLLKQ